MYVLEILYDSHRTVAYCTEQCTAAADRPVSRSA